MKNDPHVPAGERLQKVLAQAGVASRRASEELIKDGRVTVDGQVVTKLGTRVDPETQVVHVDGSRILTAPAKHVVLALNKPEGVVSTMSDPDGRPCISDLLVDYPERLYNVGRLDIDTQGLLLLTNDGELAHRLMHPSYEVEKTYVARVHGEIKPWIRKKLLAGVELEDGPVKADAFTVKDTLGDISAVEVKVHEGRNRMVRRMLAQVGLPVTELIRTKFGPVKLDRLKPGDLRRVKGTQLQELYDQVGL